MIGRTGFSGCCGINIIYGLGKTATASARNDKAVDQVMKDIKYELSKDVAITLIALNQDQRPTYEPALNELGFFACVQDAYHHAHKSKITLYARVNNPDETYKTKDHGTKSDTKGKVASTRNSRSITF